MLAVVDMAGGLPNIDMQATPYGGHAHIWTAGNFGLYLFGGTAAQLTALNALPQVRGLAAMNQPDFDAWAELDGVISGAVRTEFNTLLTAHAMPTIPASTTYRQVFSRLFQDYRKADMNLLEHTVSAALRTVTNSWLSARSLPTFPAAWTYFQLIQAIDERLNQKWAELSDVIDPTLRTKLNTWLTARGYPTIPAGWTYRQVVRALIRRMRQYGADTDAMADDVLNNTLVKDV
jgi:hypothetical protein